jgi:3-oxoacyl-[acyl-carrier-protein] synthase III
MMRYNNIGIGGVGAYIPPTVLTNEEIENRNVGTTADWIYDKLGIRERHIAGSETTADMGYIAALEALDDAGIDKEDLDLIIVATSSPEQVAPSIACTIHNKLNIKKDVPAFDINAVCTGFVYAAMLAGPLISTGAYENILIIATEAYSNNTDWGHRNSVFFGDGAGAVVMNYSEDGWMIPEISSNGSGTGMTGFSCKISETFIMHGKEVWDHAIKVLPKSINNVLLESGLMRSDIKMIVPHQPSINILKELSNSVGIPMDNVKTVMDKYANIAGASVPIALHSAIRSNEISVGDNIILTAVGSGWTWGSILLNYQRT